MNENHFVKLANKSPYYFYTFLMVNTKRFVKMD